MIRLSIEGKEKEGKRIVLIMLPILLLAFAAVAYGGYLFTKASDVAAGSKEELVSWRSIRKKNCCSRPKKDSISILIMGVDDSNTRRFWRSY